jgi:hypothetical protein
VARPTYVGLGGRALHPQFALFFLAAPEAKEVASRFPGATVERHVIYKTEDMVHGDDPTAWKVVVHGEEGYARWLEHPEMETPQQDLEERASMILPDPAMPTVPPEYGGTVLDIYEDQPSRAIEFLTELTSQPRHKQ